MEIRLVEEMLELNSITFFIISLILDDEKFDVTRVMSQYCESHMKLFDFYNCLYSYLFVNMDVLVSFWENEKRILDMDQYHGSFDTG